MGILNVFVVPKPHNDGQSLAVMTEIQYRKRDINLMYVIMLNLDSSSHLGAPSEKEVECFSRGRPIIFNSHSL
jgi:hypothetical protein